MNILKHLERVKAGATSRYSLSNLATYIENNICLDGKPYSFQNFEFQRKILNDTSPISLSIKIAQIGLSTLSYAHALAACAVNSHWGYGYVFPFAADSQKACATRINPMIAESPEIKRLVNPGVDSTELKQIGTSFLYFRGCNGTTAALSISLDFLTIDEFDRCDPAIAAQYVSRLQGKSTKMKRLFSTPTFERTGIMGESLTAKRYRHIAKCARCNHQWLPRYQSDIVIPDWNKALTEITKYNIKDIRWKEARWNCPSCGRDPLFSDENLEWVCENPHENYEANAWFISPVTGHKQVPPPYLVNISTQYGSYTEFTNQALGEAVSTSEDNFAESDIRACIINADLRSSDIHYFGADMGLVCYITIGRPGPEGEITIVHREKCPLAKFETRRQELMREYRIVVSVHDMQPYVDMINRITEYDPNSYGAVFVTSKSAETYLVVQKKENPEEGKLNVRRINVNRTAALDAVMTDTKQKRLIIASQHDDEEFIEHLTSMKRTRVFDKNEELMFHWAKAADKTDHWHFSLLYCWLAIQIRATNMTMNLGTSLPLVRAFRVKPVN